jgi:uncharacterized membrane protein (DUF4010 family)
MTTLVIARRTRDAGHPLEVAAALVAPTSMMYVRMVGLVAIFDRAVALRVAPWFLLLAIVTAAVALLMSRRVPGTPETARVDSAPSRNPLELSAAAVFALLLAVMAVAAHYAMAAWPGLGLPALAVIAGFSEVEPFVISLLQMKAPAAAAQIVEALVVATAANNILKAACALAFAQRAAGTRAAAVLSGVALLSLTYLLL